SHIRGIRDGLRTGDLDLVSHTIDAFLAGSSGQQIDAITVTTTSGRAVAAANVSMLNLPLPLTELSQRYGVPGAWRSVSVTIGSTRYALLLLSIPVTSEVDGQVVGTLNCFVLLNDNFWITSQLQSLFNSDAIYIVSDGQVLDKISRKGFRASVDPLATLLNNGLYMRGDTILREHTFSIDQSTPYSVLSVLPNSAYQGLQSAYLSQLSYALLLVVILGILAMLVIRKMTRGALSHLAQYAEQVPESGSPQPFSGSKFKEFARVGRAVERMLLRIRERDKRLSSIIDNAPDLIFIKDLERRYLLASEKLASTLALQPDQIVGRRDDELLKGETLARAQETDRHVIESGRPIQYESELGEGSAARIFLLSKFPILDDDGAVMSVGCIATDISTIKKVQEELDLAHQVVAATNEAIIVLDADNQVISANRAFQSMCNADEFGSTLVLSRFLSTHPQISLHLHGHEAWQGECSLVRADGSSLPVLVSITQLPGRDGQQRSALLFSDITNLKQAERKLEQLALYDALTGLPNRSQFHQRLMKQLLRAPDTTAVLFIDIDNFKSINDSHGHALGDAFLRRVADRLRTCVQAKDTVARLGGDEFTVIIADVSTRSQAQAIAMRILHVLREPFELGTNHCFSSASIGIAMGLDSGEDPEAMLNNADLAMYEAKMSGRNACYFFDPAINAKHQRRYQLEEGLRDALVRRQLFVEYQPRFNISASRVLAAEALVRWHHPVFGTVSPGEFIPIAESSNLIVEIGRFVLSEACREASMLHRDGFNILLSVNLSPRQLRDRDLIKDIEDTLYRFNLPPHLLELEITETYVMENIDQFIPVLSQIRALGVRLAVDDFGTGYSSLMYLKKLPVNTVKIDYSFIRDIPGDQDDENLVRAIISMSHNLRLRVVAEGVVTAEQLQF
ncbi:MAG: EAL domain-containing protein, partial [Oceanospirillales bacterium]|nr:EAL domain-containing protein [Oceanospirillales bacterium]